MEGVPNNMALTKLTTVMGVLLVLGLAAYGSEPPVFQRATDEEMTDLNYKMFPDGRDYDFGKVPRGALVKFAFRIVNTSDVTLTIADIKVNGSPQRADMIKRVLQPKEEGKLEVSVDARRFVGRKTMGIWLTTEHGEVTQTFRFLITGIAE